MPNGLCRLAAPHRVEGCGLPLALAHRAGGIDLYGCPEREDRFPNQGFQFARAGLDRFENGAGQTLTRANIMPTVFFFLAPSETTYWIVSDPRRRSSLRALST
jgi:hypothetical protein